ncbi:MAG: RNA polymerase sigma factor [Planctomycetes bacterium]|nr:RNA polymerase sigma factor [Planctomycetota bacterium]
MTERPEDEVDKIFVTHGERMLRQAKRLLASDADAEDAVQDVLLSILRAPHVLSDVESLGAWLFTLVRRRCYDILRGVSRRPKPDSPGLEEFLPVPAPKGRDGELARTLAQAIAELPDDLRYAFVENALHEKPFREMEMESGVPMGTLMARKQKAVEQLRRKLMGEVRPKESN